MRYIKDFVTAQIEIDKSLFIGILYPVEDTDNLLECLQDAKMKFPKANHYCSASIIGESMEHQTAQDDGEPQRTAGLPILEVLKHHDVTNVLCVVVRYFGGIKLGAGGLVRAYTKATAEVLKRAVFYQKRRVLKIRITFGYPQIQKVEKHFEGIATILDKTYLENVSYTLILDHGDTSHLLEIQHLLEQVEDLGFVTVYE